MESVACTALAQNATDDAMRTVLNCRVHLSTITTPSFEALVRRLVQVEPRVNVVNPLTRLDATYQCNILNPYTAVTFSIIDAPTPDSTNGQAYCCSKTMLGTIQVLALTTTMSPRELARARCIP